MNNSKNSSGFVAGTLVHTQTGLKPIEQIQVGDFVLSKPETGEGEVSYKRVVNTFEFDDKEVWYVSYIIMYEQSINKDGWMNDLQEGNDNINSGFVIVTGNHPFWVAEVDEHLISGYTHFRKSWVRADELYCGMFLQLGDGRVALVGKVQQLMPMAMPDMGWLHNGCSGVEDGNVIYFQEGHSPQYGHGPIGKTPLSPRDMYGKRDYNGNIIDDLYLNEGIDWYGRWLKQKVYNLEVEDHHTYFVDKLGVWVHDAIQQTS